MDFSFTTEQEELRNAVRGAMSTLASNEVLVTQLNATTGYMPRVWDQMSQAGWLGLAVPEEFGGSGAAMSDIAVIMEEFGRGPLPQIFFVAATLSPLLIMETADAAQKRRWLQPVAEGAERITVALTEADYGWSPEHIGTILKQTDAGLVLDGTKTFVPDIPGATRVLVAARVEGTDRIVLVILDPDAPGVRHESLEGFVSWQSIMTLDGVKVDADDVLGSIEGDAWPGIERAIQQAIPLLCAYQVGSCQAVFEMSLSHTRTREQFGQPIGRFQRVQDHLIELVNHLDAARWSTYEAIWKWETDAGSAPASIHMTKSIVSEAHWEACNFGHEIHAGLGADRQYGLAKHTYLSRSLFHFLGEPRWHRDRMATALNW